MQLEQRLLNPFKEAKYLSDKNSYRYVTIIHYLCEQHRLYAPPSLTTDIYAWIKDNDPAGMFSDYQEHELDYDLKVLEENGNVISHQDSSLVSKIEDLKKRRLRYQCTRTTIELERKLSELNESFVKIKGSLDPTLTDSLRRYIESLNALEVGEVTSGMRADMHRLWNDLFARFKDLQQETSDYLAIIQSKRVDEALQNKEISAFRVKFTDYLKNFVMVLQEDSSRIEYLIRQIEKKHIMPWFLSEMVIHYRDMPLFDDELQSDDIKNIYEQQWQALRQWFVLGDGSRRYVDDLIRETSHTISKFVKYLQIMSERDQEIKSRKYDFLHFASLFEKSKDLQKCKRYFSTITNIQSPPHLLVDKRHDINNRYSILEHDFPVLLLKQRIDYERRKRVITVTKRTELDEILIAEMHARKEYEEALIEEFTSHREIALADLQIVEPFLRNTILYWIGRASSSAKGKGKTENGKTYYIEIRSNTLINMYSPDGTLRMPDYVFRFGGSH
ncbi:TIGR02677 family protein [Brevibacillus laterosporus]|uniref:TIGR02677 family protein n=1 Tax=Brevibacillus laterosporus TaxID=1465 RepID=A0AAP3DJN2_BRELA|nr:TIGR02677 family protein [Brevibacillus laterosporus]MCR8982548.1 TIGR02677 family protein [Brevibacillus laterosporus]MCZ0809704.1 TIGR02677 family protein [Brevibacillus laterosporus]MCZ0828237.1 TIGR02677 family protein [Brevibacillus laterosporus]MCZ0852259.1 TIGR02677 family protein [Brevibacillus laterosporus]